MPHIVVEYTETLSVDVPKLLSELHKSLAGQDTVDIHSIKTRSVPVKYVIVGDGQEPDKMIHVTLRLLPGRDDDLKKAMAQALFDVTRKNSHDDRISVSVEVVDMHAASYTK